jgi:hypothetical protein
LKSKVRLAFHVRILQRSSFGIEGSLHEPADLIYAARICDNRKGLVDDIWLRFVIFNVSRPNLCMRDLFLDLFSPHYVDPSTTTWRSILDLSC